MLRMTGSRDGGQDQGDNGGLHEHTADQQEDDDQQQQDGAVAGDAQQSVCNGDRDVIEHDAVAEHAGERQNDGDDGDVLHAVAQGLQQALPSQLVVEHGADQQGVCAGKGAGLGGLMMPKRIRTISRTGNRMAQILSSRAFRISDSGAGWSCSGL